jgi:hypothetical protein
MMARAGAVSAGRRRVAGGTGVNAIAAIWHHPGTPPTGAGAGNYPVGIVTILKGPIGPLALCVDSNGRINTAPAAELEVVDQAVSDAIGRAQQRLQGVR